MGTRADFYVGRGEDAEWLGSIAWDGYPEGIDAAVLEPTSEDDYREAVALFLGDRDDATAPEQGWPWPWDDSGTTDYAYAFDGGQVWGSCFGTPWFHADVLDANQRPETGEPARFPDMSERKAVTYGRRSGVTIIGGGA